MILGPQRTAQQLPRGPFMHAPPITHFWAARRIKRSTKGKRTHFSAYAYVHTYVPCMNMLQYSRCLLSN